MHPSIYLLTVIWLAALGLAVGSFLNVVIFRLPRSKSLWSPGSSCPSCGHPIPWYLNIPLLSWLILRGKCRWCGWKIPVRYPFVEASASALVVLAFLKYGYSPCTAQAAVVGWAAIALAFIDYDWKILPDVITLPLVLVGLGFAVTGCVPLLSSAAGALVGAAIPAGLIVAYQKLRGIEGMGWGDVKYLAAIGANVGLRGCLQVLIASSLLGALVGVALILAKKAGPKTELPFGTFLSAGLIFKLLAPASWLAFPHF